MQVAKKTYAEFTMPGTMFLRKEIVEVKTRDIQSLTIPKDAFLLEFFDVSTPIVPRGKKKRAMASNPANYSPLYNIGLRIYTKKKMAEETAREKGLSKDVRESRERMMKEMANDKLKYALKCRAGGFIKLEKGELVLLLNGKKRELVKVN